MFSWFFEDTVDEIVEDFVTAKDKLVALAIKQRARATYHLAVAGKASHEASRADKIAHRLAKLLED